MCGSALLLSCVWIREALLGIILCLVMGKKQSRARNVFELWGAARTGVGAVVVVVVVVMVLS